MAKTSHTVLAFVLLFHIFMTIAVDGRHLPNADVKKPADDDGIKHPEWFLKDRGYLIPGLGRGILPKCKDGFNPFTYNPVTGGHGGIAGEIPKVYGGHGHGKFFSDPIVEGPSSGDDEDSDLGPISG